MSIVVSLIIFSLIVVIHEFGHFIAAKRCGIVVEEFAIGMGPKLFSVKFGGTVYSLRVLPIGGFCQMLGEDSSDKREGAFGSKSVLQRMIVIVAGVLMNFLLAFVVFAMVIVFSGLSTVQVDEVLPDYPAGKVGILPGDIIKSIDGNKVNIDQDLNFYISELDGRPVDVIIERDKKIIKLNFAPVKNEDGQYMFGFRKKFLTGSFMNVDGYDKVGFFETFRVSLFTVLFYIKITFVGLGRLISMRLSLKEMAGPVGIVKVIGDTYSASIKQSFGYAVINMANFMAILSANIGIFNLLPFPALDGGRLAFLIFEAVSHKQINAEKESMVHLIGFVILMVFAAIVAVSDIIKII